MDPNASSGSPQKPAAGDKPAVDRMRDAAADRQQDADLDKEEMLWAGGYSAKAMYGSWLLALLVSIAAVVLSLMFIENKGTAVMVAAAIVGAVWIVLLLILAYRKLSLHYELTSQRFVHKQGILRRVTDRIEAIDIDDVTFVQGIIQRMLGVGSVKIVSSDRTHPELWMRGIDDVQQVASIIDDVRRRERRKRGLHIEAI
jgi:uncharacterized membrane protein YdbT with pleckstrin-like domain